MKVLILGANGMIARVAIKELLERTDVDLTLFARDAKRLNDFKGEERITIVDGDVTNIDQLKEVMPGHDIVYANLDGPLKILASHIVSAMKECHLTRLIFISSMGIYNEVPGQRYQAILEPYRDAAFLIEESSLDYTIIRPAWLNNKSEVDYGITTRYETFENGGAVVSRLSVADLIVKIIEDPSLYKRESLGVHKSL